MEADEFTVMCPSCATVPMLPKELRGGDFVMWCPVCDQVAL